MCCQLGSSMRCTSDIALARTPSSVLGVLFYRTYEHVYMILRISTTVAGRLSGLQVTYARHSLRPLPSQSALHVCLDTSRYAAYRHEAAAASTHTASHGKKRSCVHGAHRSRSHVLCGSMCDFSAVHVHGVYTMPLGDSTFLGGTEGLSKAKMAAPGVPWLSHCSP